LLVVRKYIGDGTKIWDLAQSSTNFATWITHFKQYLQKYMENDEGSYKDIVGTILAKV
jgi:hypothetical protein